MQGGKEAGSAFVVACGDGTEVLEATEEAFNVVALLVKVCIVRTTAPLVYFARDRRLDAALAHKLLSNGAVVLLSR